MGRKGYGAMIGPWFRWRWPEDDTPRVLMDFPSREEAERDLRATNVDDGWIVEGVSFESDMLSDPSLREALTAFQVEEAKTEIRALEGQTLHLRSEVYYLEEDILRELLVRSWDKEA